MKNLFFVLAALIMLYTFYDKVLKPAWKAKVQTNPESKMQSWFDFITAQINTAKTMENLNVCDEMIILFDQYFSKQVHRKSLNAAIETLYNRIETRKAAIVLPAWPQQISANMVL